MRKIDWYNHPQRKELEKAYRVLAKNCGIKAGDTIRLLRRYEGYELGCQNAWIPEKNHMIGKTFIVHEMCCGGDIRIVINNQREDRYFLNFPFFAVEKIEDATPEIVLTIDGKEVKISNETLENIRKEL